MSLVSLKNIPGLDPHFCPIHAFNQAFLDAADMPVTFALEGADGQMAVCHTRIHSFPQLEDKCRFYVDRFYLDRFVRTMLWTRGGFRILVSGDQNSFHFLREAYGPGGSRAFDAAFMARVYEHPFQVVWTETPPEAVDRPRRLGGHLNGCRIGFDAGGSDLKVSAVLDGEPVFFQEVIRHSRTCPDPEYHYREIVSALQKAASHLPRVDGVGISSAGIHLGNRTMTASLFREVPEDLHETEVKDLYLRAVRDTFGDIPFQVLNDGEVSALAWAMSLGENNVLGIAMDTSEAAGYVDQAGCITGWLNELAFVPVDIQWYSRRDEWSGARGCGGSYFSQDCVIALADRAGIPLEESTPPARKLKAVQDLMDAGDPRAVQVFETIGTCLGHTLPLYHDLYHCSRVLLLGRVMSGTGGDLILEEAKRVLADEYPDIARRIRPALPDQRFRRLGRSVAAASLPEVKA